MTTRFCPGCGYELTEASGTMCPRCGRSFQAVEVQYASHAAGSIGVGEVVLKILWPPGLFLIGLVLLGWSDRIKGDRQSLIQLPIFLAILVAFIASIVVSARLAARLRRERALKRGGNNDGGAMFTLGVFVGLFCCQMAIGFGGCVALLVGMYAFGWG